MTTLHHGDCLDVLRSMHDNSVDSIVTDPPYGLSFMGKRWDYDVPSVEIWAECLRVLKPGGHLLAFAGTRTQHRMAVRIEDAGFEIRDMIAWVYGSGFPKSLNVANAVEEKRKPDTRLELLPDEAKFCEWMREQSGLDVETVRRVTGSARFMTGEVEIVNTATKKKPRMGRRAMVPTAEAWKRLREHMALQPPEWVDALVKEPPKPADETPGEAWTPGKGNGTAGGNEWQGWGTALKPALETVTFASKPYTDEQERDIIQSNLIRLEARLWLLSFASAAEKNSTSNPSEYGAACAIAQWSADEITNTRAALCGQMDTSRFESATTTSLSIVSSWRRTLAASWNDGNTSIIETKSSTTIDWRTLKFSLSQITPASIIKACSLPGGFSVNATTAENHFNASLSLLQNILTLSATEPAISQEAESYLGAGVTPNLDPCIMARKPLIGTVAANVLAHGTGALNIDGCRVGGDAGRWPANFCHDGSDDVLAGFPAKAGAAAPVKGSEASNPAKNTYGEYGRVAGAFHGDTGSAARFFYCAKANKRDRDEGLDGFVKTSGGFVSNTSGQHMTRRDDGYQVAPRANNHPTVKPTDLMAYLCRLVTPPGGTVLDPFMGSGSTGKAAMREGFRFIGIEREAEYLAIAQARIKHASQDGRLL